MPQPLARSIPFFFLDTRFPPLFALAAIVLTAGVLKRLLHRELMS
jgi:hypothetical protein